MYGLTKPQKLIYDMEKYSGGAIAVVCGCVLRRGRMEVPAMKAAISEIIRINDALRTQIVEPNGEVTQRIAPFTEQDFEVLHFTDKADLDDYSDKYAKQPLSLYGTLYEVKIVFLPEQYGILVKLHHIISDAWTISLFGTQFFSILDGTTPKAYPYEEYAKAEKEYLTGVRYAKDREFFLEQFKKCDEVTYLSEKQSDSLRAVRKTFVMDTESSRAITEYAKAHHTSPFVLFMSALAIYISRIKMNAEHFYIGTAVLNRMGAREKNTMGMFINTVPLLVELDNTQSFAENVTSLGKSTLPLFRHQKYNYGDVLADIRKEFGFGERLYDVMLSYQNATINGGGNTESTWYHNGVQTESLQMHIDDRDSEGYFRILYDFQTDKFAEAEIKKLHLHLCNLLLDGIAHDNKRLHELNLLSADERQKLFADFNDTAVDYPREKCVHTLFEEQVAKTPDKTAVIACDKTLTYAELNAQANRIAHGLIERGIGVGDIVAFALPRRSYLLATMLGILKSGAAYLPIDPDYPQDRIDYILSDSGAKLFITEEIVQHLLDNKQKSNPDASITSDSLCYCIYTSGSTGRPKGTLLTHRNVGNYVNNNNNNVVHRIIKSNFDWVVSVTTVGFDIFVTESLLPLANGLSILLADEKQANSQLSLAELLHLHRNDVLQTTPTKMKMLIADRGNTAYLQGLKAIILGGEALDKALVQELKQLTEAKVYNIYGPTETTVWSSNTEALDDDITIGKPIANTQIYIVDKYMRPVPIGVTGELCIAGDGVGAGYLNRPELTAERFVDNPFGADKLYKTGDLAYWREDGNIVYVGRNDFQVKIRGLRIELGEIENAFSAINGISQAVAFVRKDESGRQLICAFYTGAELPAKEIRSVIGQKLPKYMLPHVITHLDTLPLTTSGKINRKALPEVDLRNLDSETEYVAPVGELEMKLSALMEQILQVSPVGRDDDFFDLGGDSLKAIELIAALEEAGYYADVKTVFESSTVKTLAAKLTPTKQRLVPLEGIPTELPATPAQLRVYTAQAMQGGTAYNVPTVFKAASVDPARLEAAVNALIRRHESLRTRFEEREGQILQIVQPEASVKLEHLESDDPAAFIRPFDLSRAPLLRVGYYENTVMIDLHHTITDGGSMPVFFRELNELYMGRELTSPAVQYRQFAMQPRDLKEDEAYWLSVFSDEVPVLEMNTDFKRMPTRSHRGDVIYDQIPAELHSRILEKCRELNITPYVFYMAAFNILLSKFSGNEDIVVGMPVSGREGPFVNTVGMFVNTVALRSQPSGEKTVDNYLSEIKEKSIAAIDNQWYSYNSLIKLIPNNDSSHNPLFDVMFVYQSEAMLDITFGDQKTELLPVPVTTSKYDFTFSVMPKDCGAVLMVEYCTEVYKETRIRRIIDGFFFVLSQMM